MHLMDKLIRYKKLVRINYARPLGGLIFIYNYKISKHFILLKEFRKTSLISKYLRGIGHLLHNIVSKFQKYLWYKELIIKKCI